MEFPPDRPTAREALPARSLPVPLRRFLQTEAAGGLALVAAAVVAIAANSRKTDGTAINCLRTNSSTGSGSPASSARHQATCEESGRARISGASRKNVVSPRI